MHRTITYFLLSITSAIGVLAQDNVDQLDLTLKNQKYQALPTEVRAVFVDQDKRLWYQLTPTFRYNQETPLKNPTVAECKAEIKAQFAKKQPILKLVKPVLFGPGKIIWFSGPGFPVIGYDGTQFIEYKHVASAMDDMGKFYVSTRRRHLHTPTAQFFITDKGILVYHKNSFSHHTLGFGYPRSLAYDPKSKQVLLVKGSMRGVDSVRLWKDGKWEKLELPEPKKKVRDAFFHQGSVQFVRENTPIVFGKYTCKGTEFYCHHENDVYLTAEEILVGDKSQGAGIVIVKADGSYAAWPFDETPTYKGRYKAPASPDIYDGKMWIYMNRKTYEFDLKTGKIVGRHELSGHIRALSGNRAYFGHFPLFVYQSDAPETRQKLPVLETVEGRPEFSEDGILYIQVPTKHKTVRTRSGESITIPSAYRYNYYDGKEWNELPNLSFEYPERCMMGRNHTFIDFRGEKGARWRLLKNGKVIDSQACFELIQRNRNTVSENVSDARFGPIKIVTSGPDQIWATVGDEFKVLSGNTWIDIDAELKKKTLKMEYFTKIVDGCVYLFAHSRNAGKRVEFTGFIASVDNSKLKLQPAYFGNPCYDVYSHVREPKALWLNVVESTGSSQHGPPLTVRVNSSGALQTIKHKGHATVYDEIGNLWIGTRTAYSSDDKGIYHIWRDGKIVSSIRIPGGSHISTFFSDKPGSVYVWTELGLHHYLTNPQDPATYSLVKTYYVPSVSGLGVTFSQRGFFVVYVDNKPSIVALPKK